MREVLCVFVCVTTTQTDRATRDETFGVARVEVIDDRRHGEHCINRCCV
jgi:hypothetical protein